MFKAFFIFAYDAMPAVTSLGQSMGINRLYIAFFDAT
jgi:hypothetical protein